MKILMINSCCGVKSTGRICTDLADALTELGHEVKIAYGREIVPEKYQKYAVRIGSDFDVKMHALQSRVFDSDGFGSKRVTERLIEWVKKFNPDIIHLHNLHGYYINIEVLFDYLSKANKKVIWTLHDCWSFTGHCTYFTYAKCGKWLNGCNNCPQKKEYPSSLFFDNSLVNWRKKKKIFTSVKNMTIVTPSNWLANLVRRSYLSHSTIKVIHNGIDTEVFKPVDCKKIARKLRVSNKRVLLGVAAVWNKRKGLEDFIELSKIINDEEYQIILVGLSKAQIETLPANILGIGRTDSVAELAELYSLAYVFINPTYEDNYPTTNIESISCNTPVITYDTGGSKESALIYGLTTAEKSANGIYKSLYYIDEIKVCIDSSIFSKSYMVNEYIKLFI